MDYFENLDSSFILAWKTSLPCFTLKLVCLVAYFTCFHEMICSISHPLTVILLRLFFLWLFIGWCLGMFLWILLFLRFSIISFISSQDVCTLEEVDEMLKFINGENSKSHNGHSTSLFSSKFLITFVYYFWKFFTVDLFPPSHMFLRFLYGITESSFKRFTATIFNIFHFIYHCKDLKM